MIIFSSFLHIIGISLIGFIEPTVGFIIFSIGYNFRIASQYPMLAKIVPAYHLGKAFGLIRSLKDFFGMVIFIMISIILKKTHSYQNVVFILLGVSALIFILAIIFYKIGKRKLI